MTDATKAPKIKFADLPKDEKIKSIEAEIARLTQKLDDVKNDRVPAPKAKAEAYVPAVGASVLATIGRTTATTQARVVEAVVLAVRIAQEGEKVPTQVRIEFGEGFDKQTATVYPANLKPNVAAMADEISDDRAVGELAE